mmetsp:Transcript_44/g.94  ORF Transcript_44/g.94 Transcript_44/m.94 type:complete len:176 (-) Transcript_44:1030-1557(-)
MEAGEHLERNHVDDSSGSLEVLNLRDMNSSREGEARECGHRKTTRKKQSPKIFVGSQTSWISLCLHLHHICHGVNCLEPVSPRYKCRIRHKVRSNRKKLVVILGWARAIIIPTNQFQNTRIAVSVDVLLVARDARKSPSYEEISNSSSTKNACIGFRLFDFLFQRSNCFYYTNGL